VTYEIVSSDLSFVEEKDCCKTTWSVRMQDLNLMVQSVSFYSELIWDLFANSQ